MSVSVSRTLMWRARSHTRYSTRQVPYVIVTKRGKNIKFTTDFGVRHACTVDYHTQMRTRRKRSRFLRESHAHYTTANKNNRN